MDTINFEDFKKIDIRIGKIISAEKIEDSNKLLKLEVDFVLSSKVLVDGKISEGREVRQIIAGLAQFYAPETLIGKECPFAYNLATRVLNDLESQGMILCASTSLSTGPSDNGSPVLLHPDKEIKPGSIIK